MYSHIYTMNMYIHVEPAFATRWDHLSNQATGCRWAVCRSNRQPRTTTHSRSLLVPHTELRINLGSRHASIPLLLTKQSHPTLVPDQNPFSKSVPHRCMVTMLIYTYLCTYMYMYKNTFVHKHINSFTYMYVYIHIFVHIRVYTYMYHSIHICQCNMSTRRVVQFRWDLERYTNLSFLAKKQRGEGPRISILMDINNL